MGRPTGTSSQQNAANATATSKADELYVEARNRYKEVQRVNVPPGWECGTASFHEDFKTEYRPASRMLLSHFYPAEEASIFVNGSDKFFISTNHR